MSAGISNANPTERFGGSEATGTEGAAESFTEFLENEAEANNPRPPKRERREAPASQDGAEDGDEGQTPDTRQPKRERAEDTDDEGDDPLRDPLLDGDEDEADDKGDTDEDGDDEADDTDDEDGDDEEGEEDPEFEVKVNGETVKVKQSELIAGYSREADYRQKTTELASEREEIEAYATETVQQRQRYEAGIQMYADLIASVMPSQAEWDALEKADPQAFIAAQKQWGGFLGKIEASKAERDALDAEKAKETERANGEYIKAENKQLLKALPQLANPKVAKQFSDKIFAYGKRMGYTPEELTAGLINHRDVQTAYYAARYLEIQDSRKANQGKAKGKPRAAEVSSNPRPIASPKGRQQARASRASQKADRELARTGTIQSAATAFSSMFRD